MDIINFNQERQNTVINLFNSLERPEEKLIFLNDFKDLIKRMREVEKELERFYIEKHKGERLEIGGNKYWVGEKTETRFFTQKVYETCLKVGNPYQKLVECLPKNPVFKKTEIQKLMDETGEKDLYYEDIKDELVIKNKPKEM